MGPEAYETDRATAETGIGPGGRSAGVAETPAPRSAAAAARSPTDVLHLVAALTAALSTVLVGRLVVPEVAGVGSGAAATAPGEETVIESLVAVAGLLVFASLVAFVIVSIARRQWRLLATVGLAAIIATVTNTVLAGWMKGSGSPATLDATMAAAILVAVLVGGRPWLGQAARKALVWALTVIVLLSAAVASPVLLETTLALAAGWAAGAASLLILGAPARRPTVTEIEEALEHSGLPLCSLRAASVDARGSTPYFAETTDGRSLFVKVLGTDERSADLLFRAYRFLALRNLGDERPFSSLRRTVEHEALLALAAEQVGVRTPRLAAAAAVGDNGMLLAYQAIRGKSLDGVEVNRLTDAVVEAIWAQVALLRHRRIAHRDLRLANVFLDDDDTPWLIDFGFGEMAASDDLLAADVAELVASLSLPLGAARAAEIAVRGLGATACATALPRLQPLALSGATRTALGRSPGLLSDVRSELQTRCGAEPVADVPIARVTQASAVLALGALAAIGLAALYVGALGGALETVERTAWGTWLLSLLTVPLGWLTGGVVVALTARPRVPLAQATGIRAAAAFADAITPMRWGGALLVERFLTRRGRTAVDARSENGATIVILSAAHLALWALAAWLAARGGLHPSREPTLWVAVGVSLLVLLSVAGLALVRRRRRRTDSTVPAIVSAASAAVRETPNSETLVAAALANRALVALGFVLALRAVGIDLPASAAAAVALGAVAATWAVPLPGSLGAMEAVLTAGLIAAGVAPEPAVAAVALYRLATFWLPAAAGFFVTRRLVSGGTI